MHFRSPLPHRAQTAAFVGILMANVIFLGLLFVHARFFVHTAFLSYGHELPAPTRVLIWIAEPLHLVFAAAIILLAISIMLIRYHNRPSQQTVFLVMLTTLQILALWLASTWLSLYGGVVIG